MPAEWCHKKMINEKEYVQSQDIADLISVFSHCSSRTQFISFYLSKLVLHHSRLCLLLDQLISIALMPVIIILYTDVVNKCPTNICYNYL